MCTSGALVGSLVISSLVGSGRCSGGRRNMLRGGEATGPNAIFEFVKAKPRRIVVRTTRVGVAGSMKSRSKGQGASVSPRLCGRRMQIRRKRQRV